MTFDEVISRWENRLANLENGHTFNLYIDNPFCVNQCGYCIHTGFDVTCNKKDFQYYYNEYLPSEIKKHERILNIKTPDSVYFGGGTASLLTPQQMEELFKNIPNFDDIPVKVFEGNPNNFNKSKLDILIKHHFSYVSVGVQTFEKEVLKQQNRVASDEDHLAWMIDYLKKNNVRISCDLMAYIGKGPYTSDLFRLKKDIKKMIKLDPDFIVVYPERRYLINAKERGEEDVILMLRKMLNQIRKKYNYHTHNNEQFEDPNQAYYNNYRLYRLTEEEYQQSHIYMSSGWPNQPKSQNTLGIGGYGTHQPYSYHGKDLYYMTVNNNWEAEYHEKLE